MKSRVSSLVLLLIISSTQTIWAKTVSLHEQPESKSKVVATIDLAKGIIPIFTPKTGDWIKVADPANGNVGWLQKTQLKSNQGPIRMMYSQQIFSSGSDPEAYEFVQFGPTKKLSAEETKKIMENMQRHQQALQQSMQALFKEMDQNFNAHWAMFDNFGPWIMPVMVVPVGQSTK